LIQTIHRWLEERQMTPTQIFETPFQPVTLRLKGR
jgi:hypothetical protein